MRFLIQLLWNPVEALDLYDKSGRVDHGKIVGFFTYITMLAALLVYVLGVGKLLPLGHTIALISTAYGWVGWRAFLAHRSDRTQRQYRHAVYDFGPPTYVFEERYDREKEF